MRLETNSEQQPRSWDVLYGGKHRWVRLDAFPAGIDAPAKVRIYQRSGHYILNWWDPGAGKNLSERVGGDLLAALVKAREIDGRILDLKTAGVGRHRRIGHADLVRRFLDDLGRRAASGEVAPGTADRYRTALDHYLAFSDRSDIAKSYSVAASVDRTFRLCFTAFLHERDIRGNGRSGVPAKRMRGQGIVIDTVRALFEWAGDSDRGGLLPENFKNPFLRGGERRSVLRGDPLAEPDITMAMAAEFLRACDDFELGVFAPLVCFGLRAAEPCFLFREHLLADWLLVLNVPELDYTTKGRRDKRFPLPAGFDPLWDRLRSGRECGLLLVRRAVLAGIDTPPYLGMPVSELQTIYRDRIASERPSPSERVKLRNRILADAGALTYDEIQRGFRRVAGQLDWPATATVKDFRHLFATTLANAGIPEGYRKYLLGHAPGRDAAVAYTHLNRLQEHFGKVFEGEYGPVVEAVRTRLNSD